MSGFIVHWWNRCVHQFHVFELWSHHNNILSFLILCLFIFLAWFAAKQLMRYASIALYTIIFPQVLAQLKIHHLLPW